MHKKQTSRTLLSYFLLTSVALLCSVVVCMWIEQLAIYTAYHNLHAQAQISKFDWPNQCLWEGQSRKSQQHTHTRCTVKVMRPVLVLTACEQVEKGLR